MEVIMSELVPNSLVMDIDKNNAAAAKLKKSKKKKRRKALKRKRNAILESLGKREDTENPNKSLGAAAFIDQKMTVLTPAVTVGVQMPSDKTASHDVLSAKVHEAVSGETATDNTASKKRKRNKKKKTVVGEVLSAKIDDTVNGETVLGKTATADTNSKKKKRRKKKKKTVAVGVLSNIQDKVDAIEGLSTTKVTEAISGEMVSGKTAVPDAKRVSKGEDNTIAANGKVESSATTDLNMTGTEKGKEMPMLKNGSLTLVDVLIPRQSHNLEAADGEAGPGKVATATTVSKKKKNRVKKKKQNPVSGDISSTCKILQDKVTAIEGSSSTKVLEAVSIEKVSGENALPDAKMVAKGEDHTLVSDKRGPSETIYLDMDGTEKKKKKPILENNRPTEGDIVNPQPLQNLGDANGDRDDAEIKKRKRQELKNTKPDSGDVLNTNGSTQDMVIAKKGWGTTEVLQATNGGTASVKVATPDVITVSEAEENIKVANDKMGSSANTNLKVNKAGKKIKKLIGPKIISKNSRPTLGEILNPEYLANLEAAKYDDRGAITSERNQRKYERKKLKKMNLASGGIVSTVKGKGGIAIMNKHSNTKSLEVLGSKSEKEDNPKIVNGEKCQEVVNNAETGSGITATVATTPELTKTQRGGKNLASGGILSTDEIKQDMVIMNKDSDAKAQEVFSAESKREDDPEIVNGENCAEVANTETGASEKTLKPKKKKQKANPCENKEIKEITHATLGKKLVIFDVNGMLADIVSPRPKNVPADIYLPRKAVFKRPFLDDFLSFCFEKFNVGIWSSRMKINLDPVVDCLLGDLKKKLLFVWDASHCRNSGMRTLEDRHKCLVVKDLRKIWEKSGPYGSWVKGTFNESNTLLLDDSPYKALPNPKHTGIFPTSYSYKNRDDDFLGPKGELWAYLEGFAATDDTKTYVEQHPFGQGPIDEKNPDWGFYKRVLEGLGM